MSPLLREASWALGFPLACLWAASTRLRRRLAYFRRRFEPSARTIVVGNLHSGGSAKTPLVMAIAQRLRDRNPAIVSRGYRGEASAKGGQVDPKHARGPETFGDEPWMMERRLGLPVFVGKNRPGALRAAQSAGAGLFVLDDAFQNFSFRHDVDLVSVHTDRKMLDSYCLPLGDLREPLAALKHASAILWIRGADEKSAAQWQSHFTRVAPKVPCFEARLVSEGVWGADGKVNISPSQSWGAFCGIARPESFSRSLRDLITPAFEERFPDHHEYQPSDIDRLIDNKTRLGLNNLMTTEKDWHKVRGAFEARSQQVFYLRIGYEFSDDFWYFLETRLRNP